MPAVPPWWERLALRGHPQTLNCILVCMSVEVGGQALVVFEMMPGDTNVQPEIELMG